MAATFGIASQVATTTMTAIAASQVPTGKVRRFDVRAANVHASADANISWELYKASGPVTITRGKNFPVPFATSGSAPDLEQGIVVPADYVLRIQGSAAAAIEVSVTWVEDDA